MTGAVPTAILLAVLNAVLGMALGLLASALASSEFQAVQFMPAFLLPQIVLCGLFAARDEMSEFLQWISDALPVTYAHDGLDQVSTTSGWSGELVVDILVVFGSAVALGDRARPVAGAVRRPQSTRAIGGSS